MVSSDHFSIRSINAWGSFCARSSNKCSETCQAQGIIVIVSIATLQWLKARSHILTSLSRRVCSFLMLDMCDKYVIVGYKYFCKISCTWKKKTYPPGVLEQVPLVIIRELANWTLLNGRWLGIAQIQLVIFLRCAQEIITSHRKGNLEIAKYAIKIDVRAFLWNTSDCGQVPVKWGRAWSYHKILLDFKMFHLICEPTVLADWRSGCWKGALLFV